MTLTNERFTRSEMDVQEAGFGALIQSLGYADAIRFLILLNPGQGDYLAWQERVFGDTSVDEIYEQAQKYWQARES